MSRLLLPLFLFLAIGLKAQQTNYQLSTHFGLAGLNVNALGKGVFTGASLDRIHTLSPKTNLLFGLGLQYSNYEVGANEQPCDFPLGDKIVTFTFNETYEFNPLESILRLGVQYQRGKFRLTGVLLPTFRLKERITSTYAIDFDQIGRPNQFAVNKVRTGEAFTWVDSSTRVLRYNTFFQLRAGLEIDFELTKQLSIGLGYQGGLSNYTLSNYLQDIQPDNETTEFLISEEDASTAQGYLLFRVRL